MNPNKLSIAFSLFLIQSSYAFTLNYPKKSWTTQVYSSNRNCDDFITKMSTVVAVSILATTISSPESIAFVSPELIVQRSDSINVISSTLKFDQRQSTLFLTTPSSFASSSLEISESIKTLDMELPSYGKIVSPTLSQDEIEGKEVKIKADKDGKKETKTSSSSVQVVAKKKTKPSGPTAEEKKAKAEAARAEKERKIEEKKSESLEIVGMDMPTYNAESGAKKSVFSF